MTRLRIVITGIHIGSSTFTPCISAIDDFIITHGEELTDHFYWRDEDWTTQIEWIPILYSHALPGDVVERGVYDVWKAEILEGLTAAGLLDGFFFDIHDAMSVQDMDDTKGNLISTIHGVIGPDLMVSASMDLHENVSQDLFNGCDIPTCYRLTPYEDVLEPRRRAAYNLGTRLLNGQPKPVKALTHIPVLLPGEKTSTHIEPARSFYKMIGPIETMDGILNTTIWVSFAWVNQPHYKGAVVITSDDTELVEEQAERISQYSQDIHDRLEFVAPAVSMEGYLAVVEEGPEPFFILDSGDSPGVGGIDDVMVAPATLLVWRPAQEVTLGIIYVSTIDPVAAAITQEAGVGAEVDLEVDGHVDTRKSGPLSVHAAVEALVDDSMSGHTALLRMGGLRLIVTTNRNRYATYSQFELLGVDITTADAVIVRIGYLGSDLYETQRSWFVTLTPGDVGQDLIHLGHHKIECPMFPFDPDMADPGLNVQIVVP